MEEIQLKDICDLDNGYAFKSDDYVDESNTLNCRMSNIRPDGSFDILYSAKYLPDNFADKYKDYILQDGDLIIAMTDMAGDPKILGVPTVVDTKGFNLLLNQRVGKLRFVKDGVNADYLKLALQSKRVREYLKRFAGGGVQLNVSKKDILNAPVRMRSIEEQNYIADLFKQVLQVKNQREQELQLLDDLIKARFVELFGDPIRNTQNRPTTVFINVVKMQRGFDLPVQDRKQDGDIPVYGSNGALDHHNVAKIQGGGVITGRSGTIGKVFYTEGDYWPLNTSLFSVDTHDNNVIYLAYLLQMFDLTRFVEGTGVPTLNRNMFHNKQIIEVSIDEQNKFADFVKQVDKSKFIA